MVTMRTLQISLLVLIFASIVYWYIELKIAGVDRRRLLPENQLKIDNKLYDNVDWWNDQGSFRLLRLMNEARVPYFAGRLVRGSEILDIGCGGGFVSEPLSLLGFKVHGVDASAASLERARQHAQLTGATNVRYSVMSAYELKFPDASFDGVVISDVLEHLNDLNLVASEISRILRPGGVVVFDTINRSVFSYVAIYWVAQEIFPILPAAAHDWQLFIQPAELIEIFGNHKLVGDVSEWKGLSPSWTLDHFITSENLDGSYAGFFVKRS